MSHHDIHAIEAVGLSKSYGATPAIRHVDVTVPQGVVYGFLGPNGAGKTTTIRILSTLVRPDSGRASVFGRDVVDQADEVRGLVSLTGQFASVDEDLTGRENLTLQARLLGHRGRSAPQRAAELLDAFDLSAAAGRAVRTYSGGMRRRLDIAASLVRRPALLFLDEPTTGLDPHSRRQVWDTVRTLVRQGTTVVLTTQYLDEADQLADRVGVIKDGRIVADGTPEELARSVGAHVFHLRLADADRRSDAVRAVAAAVGTEAVQPGDQASLTVRLGGAAAGSGEARHTAEKALSALDRAGIEVAAYSLARPSLDEVFLALTGESTEAPGGAAA